MDQAHHSLAYHSWTVARAVLEYLRAHANAENLRPSSSSASIAFLKIYRPGAIFLSLLLVCIVLQLGAIVLSLAMIETPESNLPPGSKEKEQEQVPLLAQQDCDVSLGTKETISVHSSPAVLPNELTNPMLLLPHQWGMVLTSNAGPGLLWRTSIPGVSYHLLLLSSLLLLDAALDFQCPASRVVTFMSLSVVLAPLRTLWTHSMIAPPSANSTFRRLNRIRSRHGTLLLPSLLCSGAQALTVFIPFTMAQHLDRQTLRWDCGSVSRILAIPGTAVTLTMCLFLPTAIALVRIEAALLPPSERTIVASDRNVIIGGLTEQSSVYATYLAPFLRALRSIDRRVMRSVLKQYVQWSVALILAASVHAS